MVHALRVFPVPGGQSGVIFAKADNLLLETIPLPLLQEDGLELLTELRLKNHVLQAGFWIWGTE
jgi:hypothetical protein